MKALKLQESPRPIPSSMHPSVTSNKEFSRTINILEVAKVKQQTMCIYNNFVRTSFITSQSHLINMTKECSHLKSNPNHKSK